MTIPFPFAKAAALGSVALAASVSLCVRVETAANPARQSPARPAAAASDHGQLLKRYCVTCHNERLKTADLKLDGVDVAQPGAHPEVWEKVVDKIRTGTMPPPNMPQPSAEDRRALMSWLETSLDAASAASPNPGRTETLRRLNRTEYKTPSEICSRSTSMRRRCCRPMRAVMASTTSRSATSRRCCSIGISRPRRKSAVSRSEARKRPCRPTPSACRRI